MLISGGVLAAGVAAAPWLRSFTRQQASVFIAAEQTYEGPLHSTIRAGLEASELDFSWLRGRRVLLKPNFVEPFVDRPHMTTHPAVIVAAARVFRDLGATVVVGEAPGHVRDTQYVLWAARGDEALAEAGVQFADLNYEPVGFKPNQGRFSNLDGIFFPRSVLEADLVVSMPKMKTHHWVGVTAAMKNLYGTLPGIKYGWPKNVLHHNGIPETVADINCTLPKTIAIVDGIECMEGDGPILGTSKAMGLIVVGTNLPAVDATIARIMGLAPERVSYLALVADRLGPLADDRIEQRGERWQDVASPFAILDRPHLRPLRVTADGPLIT